METINTFFSDFSGFLWGWPMIILLLGTHIFLTIRLKFPQRKIFTGIKLSMTSDKGSQGDVSQFGSLATALAATIGTGNIIGVGTAIALGGPGAVLWCWLTGVFGIATKYSEGLLAIKYRVKTSNGEMLGGPMYALERGLKMKWMAVLFCIFTAIAAFGIGNSVQANSLSMLLKETISVPIQWSGIVLAALVALVILYGVKGIARVSSALVPFMALFYIMGSVIILCINFRYLNEAFSLIITSAFSPRAAGAGFVGSTVMMAARFGIARGLFSNESGMGSAPIVAAAAKTRNPVRQALVSASGTFWDTVVICALTGMVLVSTIIAHPDLDYTNGASLTKMAFAKIPVIGMLVLTVGLATFTFSTILGWGYYGEKAVEYLGGKHWIKGYRILWVIATYIGAVMNLTLVWNIADCMNALMAIPNLIAVILLSNVIAKETNHYLWNNHLDELSPPEDEQKL
ncbi:MAG: alanine/glycine:cation symporter family protein [Bacteroidales bacterium]|nr:alanine/glycine:cation symporter family protein [Bacteroidales bacterium]